MGKEGIGGDEVNNGPVHKESYYQAKILRWLRDTYPAAFIWKAAAGPYSQGGIPDICAIINGHFYGFEVKRPEGGRLSKLQELTIQKINAAGGTAAVVSYPTDCQKIIDTQKAVEVAARAAESAINSDRIIARAYGRLETAATRLRAVSGMGLDEVTEKFLAGYELRPPIKGEQNDG